MENDIVDSEPEKEDLFPLLRRMVAAHKVIFAVDVFLFVAFLVSGFSSTDGKSVMFFYQLTCYFTYALFVYSVVVIVYASIEWRRQEESTAGFMFFTALRTFVMVIVLLLAAVLKMASTGTLLPH